ncbi:taspase, threonine aspartase, 1 [Mortierella sp. AM989]|nr:taspase, threonine aspartase, 1 [Mortierella sp. AM989]
MDGRGFVAVHVGAAGVQLLKSQTDQTANATAVVEHMIRILEDDPVTNAGTGSNLNLDGFVECDASIMNGTTLGYGSVGAVSDFKNPISVAAKILEEADQGPLSLGRIPPIMLVGPGVTNWVETMGFTALDKVHPKVNLAQHETKSSNGRQDITAENRGDSMTDPIDGSLVTKEALSRHIRFQAMLHESLSQKRKVQDSIPLQSSPFQSSPPSKKREMIIDESLLQDTVGAICVDSLGRVAAGVSSGGIAMKFPGRVSEAAIYGAGCWAQDPTQENPGFACSMTGAGEQICKTLLARTCMEILVYEEEEDTATAVNLVLERFINSPLLKSYGDRNAGFIAVKVCSTATEDLASKADQKLETAVRVEFVFAHTTQTMGLAYMSTRDNKPTAVMSQRKAESKVYTQLIKI